MKRCPSCNRTYAEDLFTFCLDDGALLSAPFDPEQTIRIPAPQSKELPLTEIAPPPVPVSSNQVELTISFPGAYTLLDSKVEVYLDGEQIGVGSIKRGINLQTKTITGKHVLKLKHTRFYTVSYDLEFSSSGKYTAWLKWGTWSDFDSSLDLDKERI